MSDTSTWNLAEYLYCTYKSCVSYFFNLICTLIKREREKGEKGEGGKERGEWSGVEWSGVEWNFFLFWKEMRMDEDGDGDEDGD